MKSTSPINDLPTEILDEIFTLYYHSEIFSPRILKLVCRRWCSLVDHMPIMHSDIVLAPDLFCECNLQMSRKAVWTPCRTVARLNQALDVLGYFKFKLTVLGCRTCFRKANAYDTDLDQSSIDRRCRSLQIFCPVDLATPLIESINDAPNLESFEICSIRSIYDQERDLMQTAINHVLLK
ncbi:hypothetical protein CPB86DRAFT_604815 [Serendipita vermifera]|nr:hypothetical protein CPB86DRAFT_604815 [Serendipita vermifera]